jgi:hypothetical protein
MSGLELAQACGTGDLEAARARLKCGRCGRFGRPGSEAGGAAAGVGRSSDYLGLRVAIGSELASIGPVALHAKPRGNSDVATRSRSRGS